MPATEIAPRNWNRFFERVTRLHNGAIVEINTSGERPLRGISADRGAVMIETGNVRYRVPSISHVRVQQTGEGALAELDLDAYDGTHTVVRFHSPIIEELLDPSVE